MKALKTLVIILDIIVIPLMIIKIIGGDINWTLIASLLISNVIIFGTNKDKKQK